LEALRILEAATLNCREHSIDTPEVNQVLDVLEPYCRPEWRVAGFRHNLNPCGESGVDRKGNNKSYGLISAAFMRMSRHYSQLKSER
jgi:hypothetical protein